VNPAVHIGQKQGSNEKSVENIG